MSKLSPETPQRWGLALESGEYVVVDVRQKGVDVVVRVLGPDGSVRRRVDLPSGTAGTERAMWVAKSPGVWQVEVAAFDSSPEGVYDIEWVTRRLATELDFAEIEADSLNQLAAFHHKERRHDEAERLYRRALETAEVALGPEHRTSAHILYNLATQAYERGRLAEAGPLLERTVAVMEAALEPGDPELASSLTTLASYYSEMGLYRKAGPLFQRSVLILRAAFGPQDLDVAGSLNNLGAFYYMQARYAEAEPLYLEALKIRRTLLSPDHPVVAANLDNLGLLYQDQGRYLEAEARFDRALRGILASRGPDHPEVVPRLQNLAWFYADQGRYAEAEVLHRRALEILEATLEPGHPQLAGAVLGLASLHHLQARWQEAEHLYRRALELWMATGVEHPDAAFALDDLAMLLARDGRLEEAEQLHLRALRTLEASDPQHPDVARTLSHLALLYSEQNRYPEADSLHRRALAILEESLGPGHPDVALTLNNLAYMYFLHGRLEEAESLVDRAIGILDGTLIYPEERVDAYALRATIRKRRQDRAGAMGDLETALRGAEALRPRVAGGEEARAHFFGRYAEHFDRMVSWLLEEDRLADAFHYAERGRARVLLDQLAAGKIDLRSSIPEGERASLEAREERAKARMAEYQHRIRATWVRADLSDEEREWAIRVLADSLRLAERRYQEVYREIKNASPLWRDLITSGGVPVPLREAQRALVPDGGLMLLYQVSDEGSHLFFIPPAGEQPEVFALEVTEDLAGRLLVQQGPLTAEVLRRILDGDPETPSRRGATGVLDHLQELSGTRGIKAIRRAEQAPLDALRRLLVPDRVWSRVVNASEVVLIPDASLHRLPFEALEIGRDSSGAEARYWLDEGPPIRYAASATVLSNITARPGARIAPLANRPTFLSLSHPIYDPRAVAELSPQEPAAESPDAAPRRAATEVVAGATEVQERDHAPLTSSLVRHEYNSRGGTLTRLPGTARETSAIREALARAGVPDALEVLTGLDATEQNLREALAGKRYLHLATHGLVDERRGALFASLALTPPGGDMAVPDDDGFWQLHEIYAFKLPELELAVLSACETNVGPQIEGEGVFALSRGFLAVGARRVIASQWPVNDESTAELMGHFFQTIVAADQAGEPIDYAAALRDAKRAIRRRSEWRDPYHWAPFILTGQR